MPCLKSIFAILLVAITLAETDNANDVFKVGRRQIRYDTEELTDEQFFKLGQLSNTEHLREAVRHILVPRVVGSVGHKHVREYIVNSLRGLDWSVDLHDFHDDAPIKGRLHFHNIIATLNPNAERYLVLACHYDSKYMPHVKFVGATDSAVPCAMLLNLAKVLQSQLQPFRQTKVSLMLLFFDGEEAFEQWRPTDSIYGARRLAKDWERNGYLDKIDILMLLDLIGAPHPKFYSFFENTESWYSRLLTIEDRLAKVGMLQRYVSSGIVPHNTDRYFQESAMRSSRIEDDHIPFWKRGVPILHLIPVPFPEVWHTPEDNESIIDYTTTENIGRIVRLFAMQYLLGGKESH